MADRVIIVRLKGTPNATKLMIARQQLGIKNALGDNIGVIIIGDAKREDINALRMQLEIIEENTYG